MDTVSIQLQLCHYLFIYYVFIILFQSGDPRNEPEINLLCYEMGLGPYVKTGRNFFLATNK